MRLAPLLFALLALSCAARKTSLDQIIGDLEALNDELREFKRPHHPKLERRKQDGAAAASRTTASGEPRALIMYTPNIQSVDLNTELDALEGPPTSRWQRFKSGAATKASGMYAALTSKKARIAFGVAMFSLAIVFPPAEPALAAVAIGWGLFQLASKIKDKSAELGEAPAAGWVLKEVSITVGQTAITFLTGGLAEALPDLFGFAEDISKLVTEVTTFAAADGVHVGVEPQDIDLGSVTDMASMLRDVAEGKPRTANGVAITFQGMKDIGTPDDILAKKSPLEVGEMVANGKKIQALMPGESGFVLTGDPRAMSATI